ncbi:MAG: DUF1109 family protein [Methylocapsa sp.]|nr:DUF1109 family protein [Methylocapsa sp.]
MKTRELIEALAADNGARAISTSRALALASAPGIAIALTLHISVLGLRPQLFSLLGDPRILFKIALTILLALLSFRVVLRVAQPGARVRGPALRLWLVPALLAAAILAELLAVPEGLWRQKLVGSNALFCLGSIPLLAAAPLAGTLLALRQGAPERPALAGAAAGIFAGAIGAACYATHCPDDSPLFVAAWYSLAIGFVAAAGALAGRRWLRW